MDFVILQIIFPNFSLLEEGQLVWMEKTMVQEHFWALQNLASDYRP